MSLHQPPDGSGPISSENVMQNDDAHNADDDNGGKNKKRRYTARFKIVHMAPSGA